MTRILKAWFDGACEPINPGGLGAAAWVLVEERGDQEVELAKEVRNLGCTYTTEGEQAPQKMTNNVAEYDALLGLLRKLQRLRSASIKKGTASERLEVVVHGDSQLVIHQIDGTWACNKEHLQILRDETVQLLDTLAELRVKVSLVWVPREQNERADRLSKSLYSEGVRRQIAAREAARAKQKAEKATRAAT